MDNTSVFLGNYWLNLKHENHQAIQQYLSYMYDANKVGTIVFTKILGTRYDLHYRRTTALLPTVHNENTMRSAKILIEILINPGNILKREI